jgi:lysophospholipase L1-like esterase
MAIFKSTLLLFLILCLFSAGRMLHAADDPRPVVDDSKAPVEKPADPKLPTLFLVGDSTMKSNLPLRGWASEMPPYFDAGKINVVNRAIGGRSSRTFITEGRWDKVLAELKPGDIVMVQFGHNDAGDYHDPKAKGRPSIAGDGEQTDQALNADGKTTETIHTFGWYMRKYSSDAQARGAKVILCSMVPHKVWNGDKISRGEQATFVKWTAEAASSTGAQFIDINQVIAEGLEKLGKAKVEPLFGDARTHSTPAGAKFNARCVISALKMLKPDPLADYFSASGKAVEPAGGH